MSTGELACTYASLILLDDGIFITPEKIATLIKVANVKIDWQCFFSKLFEKRSVEDFILHVGSGGAPAAVAIPVAATVGGGGTAPAAAAEEKQRNPRKKGQRHGIQFI